MKVRGAIPGLGKVSWQHRCSPLSHPASSPAAGGSPAREMEKHLRTGPSPAPTRSWALARWSSGWGQGLQLRGFHSGTARFQRQPFSTLIGARINSSHFILNIAIYIRRGVWSFWLSPWPPLNLISNPLAPLMKFSVVYIVIKPLFGEYNFNPHYMPNIGIKYSLCSCN